MKWFRFYHEAYRNPKVQDMRPELFKFWVNFLCVASESTPRGRVASEAHLRLALGLTKPQCNRYVGELEALGLIDRVTSSKLARSDEEAASKLARSDEEACSKRRGSDLEALVPHDWDDLQPESDDSAKRQRDKRARDYAKRPPERSRDMSRDKNVTVTPRVREEGEGDRDKEGEENPPLPPSITLGLGPEFDTVADFAAQLAGDVSWMRWVSQQGMCGHPASTIRRALEEASGAGKLSQAYVAAKLRGWAQDGGPPKRKGENNGRTAVQQRPDETRATIEVPDFSQLPDTPENRAVRAIWAAKNGRAS